MSPIVIIVVVFVFLGLCLAVVAYIAYQRTLRHAKSIERGLKMVPILIHLPPPSDDTESDRRDVREVLREKVSQAETLYALIAGTAQEGFKSRFYGQRHIALEIVATDGLIHFYAAVPVALVSVAEKAILSAYPGAHVEEAEDHNIFNKAGRLASTMGGEVVLKHDYAYPVATYRQLERDPLESMINALSGVVKDEGAAVQVMLRPAPTSWIKRSIAMAKHKRRLAPGVGFGVKDVAMALYKAPEQRREEMAKHAGTSQLTGIEAAMVEAMEEKTKHPAYETLIRVVVSTATVARSQAVMQDIANAFALFESPGLNGFKFLPQPDVQGLVTSFIFRFFPPEINSMVLNSVELATLYHLPDAQFTPTMQVERQMSKQVDGPTAVPTEGLLMGYNLFRGTKKEIRLSDQDRRRHTYIVGQTGTGKSTMLENLIVQDMLDGKGFAFIDPHGDSAEKLLGLVPKERAEDIIYFNPADTEYPLGLNLFEFDDASQKDFIIQETIGMLYKLYDPGHTGIIGPRYEHWYRNAALTLMSDPNGSTFIEIPKVFTDTDYLKRKFRYLQDPTVIEFWTKEMGQTSDYHKSEMLGWFVSKFGAFMNNEMMRNIIGQTKSAFDLRDIMDNKKILIVNLSKGRVGELNAQLLGMIFVIKFQAAAMSRANLPEDQRSDFCLYVDEFQNFSTDSFASILSEARKYRLNLIVANQFIGQLSTEIRDAVFGNVGTIIAHRSGPEDAEFLVKQFAPIFDVRDLVNVPNFNSVARLMIGGLPSQPFSMQDLPPVAGANADLGLAIKQLSAAKFGLSRQQVEADIFARLSGKPVQTPAPVADSAPTLAAGSAPATVPLASTPASVATQTGSGADPVTTPPAVTPPALAPTAQPLPQPATASTPPATAPGVESNSGGSITDIVGPVKLPSAASAEPMELMKPEPVGQAVAEAQTEIDELLGQDTAVHPATRHRLSEVAPELAIGQPDNQSATLSPIAAAGTTSPAPLPADQAVSATLLTPAPAPTTPTPVTPSPLAQLQPEISPTAPAMANDTQTPPLSAPPAAQASKDKAPHEDQAVAPMPAPIVVTKPESEASQADEKSEGNARTDTPVIPEPAPAAAAPAELPKVTDNPPIEAPSPVADSVIQPEARSDSKPLPEPEETAELKPGLIDINSSEPAPDAATATLSAPVMPDPLDVVQPVPDPSAQMPLPQHDKPALAPGEISVDENGNVIQG